MEYLTVATETINALPEDAGLVTPDNWVELFETVAASSDVELVHAYTNSPEARDLDWTVGDDPELFRMLSDMALELLD